MMYRFGMIDGYTESSMRVLLLVSIVPYDGVGGGTLRLR